MRRIWTFVLFIGFSGFFLHQALKYLFPNSIVLAWAITVLVIAVLLLLLTINFARTYHERIVNESHKKWEVRSKAVKILSEWVARGELIYRRLEEQRHENDSQLEVDITGWSRGVVSAIVHDAGLDESYADKFYKGSDTGKKTPPPNERIAWMNERLVRLKYIRKEFEESPPQLISHNPQYNSQYAIKLSGQDG